MASPQKTKSLLGFISGLAVGGLGTAFIASLVAYAVFKAEERRVQRGWVMAQAVVAARALTPGEKATLDALAQRGIPEQFITSSVVKPDSAAYVQDQVVVAPLSAGDPLYWGMFLPT